MSENFLNEGNQIHNFISSSGSDSDFLTNYGSGSTSQKVTVPTVPVPVSQQSQDYAQKHQHDCTFMKSASVYATENPEVQERSSLHLNCFQWIIYCGFVVHKGNYLYRYTVHGTRRW